jgi:DNA-binding Xre family transcriptional regulator
MVRSECLDQLRRARLSAGYARQIDLAETLEMSMGTINKFFTGNRISINNFQEICFHLELNWQEICCDFSDGLDEPGGKKNVNPITPELAEPSIYVDRPPVEDNCLEALRQPNALLRIRGSRRTGKTALVYKLFQQLNSIEGYRVVYLNFNYAEMTDFGDLNRFFRWFCASIGQSLELPNLLDSQWDEDYLTPKLNCRNYIKTNFLSKNEALILCLDEVECIFPYPNVASEFLGFLRAWHEHANMDVDGILGKLRLIIVHSTESYVPLNVDESPFNIGIPIYLTDFTLQQVQELSKLYQLNLIESDIEQLMEMVGGHPDLISQAFVQLQRDRTKTLSEILETATTRTGIYGSHLRHLWRMLNKYPEFDIALRMLVDAEGSIRLNSEQLTDRLFNMGLIHFTQNDYIILRCKLYQSYFRMQLVAPNEYREVTGGGL